jgi:hypothetical protein
MGFEREGSAGCFGESTNEAQAQSQASAACIRRIGRSVSEKLWNAGAVVANLEPDPVLVDIDEDADGRASVSHGVVDDFVDRDLERVSQRARERAVLWEPVDVHIDGGAGGLIRRAVDPSLDRL